MAFDFDAIFRAHYADLVGFAQRILGERASAEDVAQEVLLELWRGRDHLVVATSMRAYLFRATRNRALNQIRHQAVALRLEPHAAPRDPAPPADRDLAVRELETAVAQAV